MTHAELVASAVRWLRGTRQCGVVLAEFDGGVGEIPDAIGWRDGGRHSILVEAKTSRSDFRADRKKLGRNGTAWRLGIERWYLTPSGLLTAADLTDGWGLIEVRGSRVRRVVAATEAPPEMYERIGRKEMRLLFAAARRHQLGVEWYPDHARFETVESQIARGVR